MQVLLQGNGLEHLPVFATSLAIGLLIGLERERSPAARAGLRTFGLVAMLGSLLALISERVGSAWVLAFGFAGVAALIVTAYLGDDDDEDPGTTTQAALLLCFGLGAAVWYGFGVLATMLAITTTILLHYKPELQTMSRNLSRNDLQSILQFAVLSFIILPILPNHDYGPYDTLNPYQTWWMVVLISGVSLAGYVALRLVGQRYGAPLLGFLGGMVSSTATTLVYARHAREQAMSGLSVVVILIANLVVLVRLGVVSSFVSPAILPQLLPVLGCGLVLGAVGAFYWWRRMNGDEAVIMPKIENPTEIKTALSFAALYALVLLAAAWLSDVAGQKGLYLLALVSGLTDVDAISLSSLRLFQQGKLYGQQAVTAIAIAYLSNLGFKLGLLGVVGGSALARRAAVGMVAAALGVALGLLVFV
ncbi:chloride channel protein [Novimethylophilus kurashikiensis]|uniref:Chloride channel protein n=1 Tax=Novimethylophilus kurashikiensis TaxID=1825523 RepID=A0A2R5F8I6_9PROT|nr:MgtC/SapB family protein [Novimethylophilus kurashikiensis]GBG13223.1 chloride channel protein [Novimethylophilus kurashikiensis]